MGARQREEREFFPRMVWLVGSGIDNMRCVAGADLVQEAVRGTSLVDDCAILKAAGEAVH